MVIGLCTEIRHNRWPLDEPARQFGEIQIFDQAGGQ